MPGEGSTIRHGWGNTAPATLENLHFMAEVCSVKQSSCNGTTWFGKGTAQRSQAERTVAEIGPSLTANAEGGRLPAGFPKLCSSTPYSHFSFPLLLSFYLANFSCLASHVKDGICGPLHQLLCLPLRTRWKALMARADSRGVPPTHRALVLGWLLWHPCNKHNTYLILPHTSASGTTDMKKFVFTTQNWSSRLEFEWTVQKCGSFTSHTKANNTLWK